MGTHRVPRVAVASVVMVACMVLCIQAAGATVTTRLPTDDTYVRGGPSADLNFDSDSYLRVKDGSGEDNDRQTLLRFDVSGIQGMVVSATLHLTCSGLTNGSPAAAFVYSVEDDAWQETTVTWNTAPAALNLLTENTDITNVGTTYSFNVTAFVTQEHQGDGVVSFLLRDDLQVKKAVDFERREDANPPELEIVTNDQTYLTLSVLGPGQVTVSPPGPVYAPGTEVTLTAWPEAGARLIAWSGDVTGTANPVILTMDADKSVWAAFEPIPTFSLDLQVSGLGNVSLDPPGGTYAEGTSVQLTATPASGWSFASWSGDLTGSANPGTLIMNGAKTVTALFSTSATVTTPVVLKQTVTGGASNAVSVSTSSPLEGKDGHLYLAAVSTTPAQTVTVVSGLGLTWSLVQSQCSGRGQASVSVWMALGSPSDNSAVSASFAAPVQQAAIAVNRYTGVDVTQPLGASVAGNTNGLSGPCSGGSDTATYSLGGSQAAAEGILVGAIAHGDRSHTPGTGWTERLEFVWGPLGAAASVSLVERPWVPAWTLQGSLSAPADWAAVGVEIRPAAASILDLVTTGFGSVTLSPPGGIYAAGTIVTLQAQPAPGSYFVGWDDHLSGTMNPLAVLMDCTVQARAQFSTVPHYDLQVGVDGGGFVQVQPVGRRFAAGTQVGMVAQALPGWTFTGWSGDVAGGVPLTQLTMAGNRQVSAHFRFTGTRVEGLWSSAAELQAAPIQGTAWNELLQAANRNFNPPNVADQNSSHNVDCLAAAIVYARTGDAGFRNRVVQALDTLANLGDPGGTTLAYGRELGAYVLAADLVGYQNSAFDVWLRDMAETYVGIDGRTLLQTFEKRPNNWGTNAFGTLVAVYAYLLDQPMLQYVRDYWVQGVTGSPPNGDFGDLSWQYDPMHPRCINPPRVSRLGLDIDGVIADDQRRGGSLAIPPAYTGYPWGAMQGIAMGARILQRVDPALAIWQVEERAIYRAAELLEVRWEQQFGGWAATGDDLWMLPFLDAAYGTSWSTGVSGEWQAGKNVGWAYVLLGIPGNGGPTSAEDFSRPRFQLYAATPSPFSQATDIRFSLALEGPVRVVIYDALGRRVATLLEQAQPAGMHRLQWDGSDQTGHSVASGVYWCRVQSGGRSETIRLIRIR